mmetsp:Transcript_27504/g.88855  ORF Transcript_27504/g.88855 Transcript_27504/m.88855 type:complete len:315 (+) Transcript_27504:223-1167(+)
MGSRCCVSCLEKAPLPRSLHLSLRRRARAAMASRRRRASSCLAFKLGIFALVCAHWCSTSATSECFWSRSALSRSRCSSRSSMCSARLAFSWPRVTQRTRRASSLASSSLFFAATASSARRDAASSCRFVRSFASPTRADDRSTAAWSLFRSRASTRSAARAAAWMSSSTAASSDSRSIFVVSASAIDRARVSFCLAIFSRAVSRTVASFSCNAAMVFRFPRIASTFERRSSARYAVLAVPRDVTRRGTSAAYTRPHASLAASTHSRASRCSDATDPSRLLYACNQSSARRDGGTSASPSSSAAGRGDGFFPLV